MTFSHFLHVAVSVMMFVIVCVYAAMSSEVRLYVG